MKPGFSSHTVFPLLIFSIILSACAVQAQVLKADVDKNSVDIGERITYTVTLEKGGLTARIEPPAFEGFEIVMGPATSSSIQMINGRTTQTQTLTYVLRSRNPGNFIIKPARARIKRKYHKSQAIAIEVRPASARKSSARGKSSSPKRSSGGKKPAEVFVTTRVDKDTVYKQEMVTVSYQLYLRVNVSGFDFVHLPRGSGFWMEEVSMPTRPVLKNIEIQGMQYQVAEIRKIVLFPTRSGNLELEPLIVDVTVEKPINRSRRSRDPLNWFFDDPFSSRVRRETRTLTAEKLELTVLDLPRKGKTGAFKGDVGEFSLRVKYDKRELKQHDALTVTATISGSGYLKSIDPPVLKLQPGFEQFDPTVTEHIKLTGGKMKGRKVFTYVIIPRRAGTFELEPISFTYFNPRLGKYKRERAGGMQLTVSPAGDEGLTGIYRGSSEVTLRDSDIRFIKDLSGPLTISSPPAYASIWFLVTLAASPLLYLLGLGAEVVLIRRRSDTNLFRRRRAQDRLYRTLKSADKLIRHDKLTEAVTLVNDEFSEFIAAFTSQSTAGMTAESVEDELSRRGLAPDFMREVLQLLKLGDGIRFGGAEIDAGMVDNLRSRIREVAPQVEKIS